MYNKEEYDHLIDRIYDSGEAIARKLKYKGVDDNEIADLTVKIMLDAVVAVQQLRRKEKLEPWLMRIAENTANAYFKERAAVREVEVSPVVRMETGEELSVFDSISDNMTVEEIIVEAEDRKILGEMMNRLNVNERRVLLMHELENRRFKEISEELGINESTARSHHRRARLKMQKYLEKVKGKEDDHDR